MAIAGWIVEIRLLYVNSSVAVWMNSYGSNNTG
jgi:hypothetical protein